MKKMLVTGVTTMLTLSGAVHAQGSITLYGLIDAGLTYTSNEIDRAGGGGHSNWQMTSGAIQDSRWGLRGAEDLGAGLKAVFTLENGFDINSGSNTVSNRTFNRQAYVGVSSREFGALTLGRQTDGLVDFVGPLSLTGTEFGGTHFAHPFDIDNLNDSFQINNSIKYPSPDFAGFRLGALYGFSNQAGGFTNNRAYSFGMSYVSGPWKFGVGYLQLNSSARTPGQLNANGAVTDTTAASLQSALLASPVPIGVLADKQRTLGAGVNYAFGPAVAGFVYSQSKITRFFQTNLSVNFQNFEGNIRYALSPAIELSGAYTYSRAGGNGGGGIPHWNQVSAMTSYRFSRRTDVYVQGAWQRVSPSGTSPLGVAWINGVSDPSSTTTQFQATAGVRHRF